VQAPKFLSDYQFLLRGGGAAGSLGGQHFSTIEDQHRRWERLVGRVHFGLRPAQVELQLFILQEAGM
jgi:hypothetical protein